MCIQQPAQKQPSTSTGLGPNNKGPITWLSLVLVTLTGGAIISYYQFEKEKKTEKVYREVATTGVPAMGGPYVLVDCEGKPVTDASYLGEYALLYFGFTHCPDICPSGTSSSIFCIFVVYCISTVFPC